MYFLLNQCLEIVNSISRLIYVRVVFCSDLQLKAEILSHIGSIVDENPHVSSDT